MSDRKLCLDLFAGLGGFSAAFADSDNWRVVTVDIEERFEPDIQTDVMDLRPSDLPDADVVLASPPCTYFSMARIQWEKSFTSEGEPISEGGKWSVALVYHALGLIKSVNPEWWFLENPQGYLRHVIGEPKATIDYCAYGHYTKKPTDFWGRHPPMSYKRCDCENHITENGLGGFDDGPSDAAERAKVPYELSEAILEAVEGRAEQKTLTEATHD